MTYKYQAFGFVIESPYPVIQVEPAEENAVADIIVKETDLSELSSIPEYMHTVSENAVCLNYPCAGYFRISNGNLIEIDLNKECTNEMYGLYLLGSCMGAILHERNLLPIHGSCVTDGKHSIIISGDSGAGKSTLASEFLKRGWKLVTDDVSLIKNITENPVVQSSYPSQKLWKDSMENYQSEDRTYHTLYQRQDREKFGVSVINSFYKGTAPLSIFVQLYKGRNETRVEPLSGFDCVDRILKNTYRDYFISPNRRNRYFQDCINLSQKISMLCAVREVGVPTQELLYEKITSYLN